MIDSLNRINLMSATHWKSIECVEILLSNTLLLLSLVDLYLLVFATTDHANFSIPLDAEDLDAIASNTTFAALAVHDKHALTDTLTGIVASASEIPNAAGAIVAAGHELVA